LTAADGITYSRSPLIHNDKQELLAAADCGPIGNACAWKASTLQPSTVGRFGVRRVLRPAKWTWWKNATREREKSTMTTFAASVTRPSWTSPAQIQVNARNERPEPLWT